MDEKREEKFPKVGIGVIIRKDGKVLMHKRIGSHGANTWSFPGGHLEFNESLENCSIREVEEEAGIKIKNIKFGALTNDIFKEEGKHYITIFMVADWDSGIPEIKEPDRCLAWDWFSWDNLPQPPFIPLQNLLNQGFDPFKQK